jgi:hypothetical protein
MIRNRNRRDKTMANVVPARRTPLPPPSPPFDISEIEQDIAEAVHSRHPASSDVFAPKDPLPAYVQHADGVEEIGRLTAEVVVKEYEKTAKEIEATLAELLAAQRRCEEVTAQLAEVAGEMKAVADRYRDEGKRAFEHIERLAKMTADARQACVELRGKIADV